MRVYLFCLSAVFFSFFGLSQNSASGTYTFTHSSAAADCSLTSGTIRLGNGTAGKVEVCLTSNSLVSTCGGGNNKLDQIYIYDDTNGDGVPDNILAVWSPATAINSCVLTSTSTGYVWIFFCPQAACDAADMSASQVSVSWSTYSAPSNDQISGALSVNQCGTSFTANNISATTTGNCSGYVGNTGPPTNQTVAFYNDLDCNSSTAGAVSPTNANGGDVSYSVENDMYYKFCPGTTGTWTVNLSKVKCYAPSGGAPTTTYGYQYALFQGTPTNLGTVISGGTSGMNQTGNTVISVVVTNTTSCYYLQIDGYGGTGCVFGFSLSAPLGLCTILPVELLMFDAHESDQRVKLNWTTVSEHNSDYFVVEKSKNGSDFEYLVQLDAAGNSNTRVDYHTWDNSPYAGYTYYRLKQVDYDGNAKYSQIVTASKGDKNMGKNIYVDYSAEDQVNFVFYSDDSNRAEVVVYNTAGDVVKSENMVTQPGLNVYTFRKNNSGTGMYLLKLDVNNETKTQKFFVH